MQNFLLLYFWFDQIQYIEILEEKKQVQVWVENDT